MIAARRRITLWSRPDASDTRSVLAGLMTAGRPRDGPGSCRRGGRPEGVPHRLPEDRLIVVTRQQQLIEKQLAPRGIAVRWFEFQAGPPLLEALNAGSIDSAIPAMRRRSSPRRRAANLVIYGRRGALREGEAIW